MRSPLAITLAAAVVLTAFSGCESPQAQNLAGDWIQPGPGPEPTVTPSPTPSDEPSPVPTEGLYEGPESVSRYVVKFIEDAREQGVDMLPETRNPTLKIQIASLDHLGSGVIGLCETSGNLRRVTFDPDFWNNVSETQRELLAHHELGHCMLYRAHRSTFLDNGAYASIMYPLIMSSSTYLSNYDYYQQELFSTAAATLAEAAPDRSTVHICNLDDL
jgi:hypothetical protein